MVAGASCNNDRNGEFRDSFETALLGEGFQVVNEAQHDHDIIIYGTVHVAHDPDQPNDHRFFDRPEVTLSVKAVHEKKNGLIVWKLKKMRAALWPTSDVRAIVDKVSRSIVKDLLKAGVANSRCES